MTHPFATNRHPHIHKRTTTVRLRQPAPPPPPPPPSTATTTTGHRPSAPPLPCRVQGRKFVQQLPRGTQHPEAIGAVYSVTTFCDVAQQTVNARCDGTPFGADVLPVFGDFGAFCVGSYLRRDCSTKTIPEATVEAMLARGDAYADSNGEVSCSRKNPTGSHSRTAALRPTYYFWSPLPHCPQLRPPPARPPSPFALRVRTPPSSCLRRLCARAGEITPTALCSRQAPLPTGQGSCRAPWRTSHRGQ